MSITKNILHEMLFDFFAENDTNKDLFVKTIGSENIINYLFDDGSHNLHEFYIETIKFMIGRVDINIIISLLENNSFTHDELNIFLSICMEGNSELVKKLLSLGADIKMLDFDCYTPMDTDIVDIALDAGVNKNQLINSLLTSCIYYDDIEMFEYYLSYDIDVDDNMMQYCFSIEMFECIKSHGFSINIDNMSKNSQLCRDLNTPFHGQDMSIPGYFDVERTELIKYMFKNEYYKKSNADKYLENCIISHNYDLFFYLVDIFQPFNVDYDKCLWCIIKNWDLNSKNTIDAISLLLDMGAKFNIYH